MRRFNRFIDEADLQDIPLTNGKYTWSSFRPTPKLDEENFLMWKFQVLTTLRGHGLQKFIGEIPPKLPLVMGCLLQRFPILSPNIGFGKNLITAWLGSMFTTLVLELLDCKTAREV